MNIKAHVLFIGYAVMIKFLFWEYGVGSLFGVGAGVILLPYIHR